MHRERYRARRRLETAVARLDEDAEDEATAAGEVSDALKEYARLFVEDDEA